MRLVSNSLYLLPLSYLVYSPQQVTFIGRGSSRQLLGTLLRVQELPRDFKGDSEMEAMLAQPLLPLTWPNSLQDFLNVGFSFILGAYPLLLHHHIPSHPLALTAEIISSERPFH